MLKNTHILPLIFSWKQKSSYIFDFVTASFLSGPTWAWTKDPLIMSQVL